MGKLARVILLFKGRNDQANVNPQSLCSLRFFSFSLFSLSQEYNGSYFLSFLGFGIVSVQTDFSFHGPEEKRTEAAEETFTMLLQKVRPSHLC